MQISVRGFLFVCIVLCVFVSCGTSDSSTGGKPFLPAECDIDSLEDRQRETGYQRDDYFPRRNSRNFFDDTGAHISLTDNDYDIARKISRSVFELDFRLEETPHLTRSTGTGWLIAPRYIATAAHNVATDPNDAGKCKKEDRLIYAHTFDGEMLKVKKVVWFDDRCENGSDLALLELEQEISAVPMRVAEKSPEKNEMLMAMGHASDVSKLGGWTVTAGPALGPGRDLGGGKRVDHWIPTSAGMSGGPIFNREAEVVSIVSAGGGESKRVLQNLNLNLWVYGFHQKEKHVRSWGPNPGQLRGLYDKVPSRRVPGNAGEYPGDNEWKKTEHPLGDNYSPFPINRFDDMNEVYKEARQATVEIKGKNSDSFFGGSGFIYDASTVITAGHVARRPGQEVTITTTDGKSHAGTVSKVQVMTEIDRCDIAVIETTQENALDAYPKLEIGDSSSLECGDPLVQIGYAGNYKGVGGPQGLAAVYMRTREYTSEYLSRSSGGGMSGGPIVNSREEVVSISSLIFGPPGDKWNKPGPLHIHTRMPVYTDQEASNGPNTEIIRKFVTEKDFYCQ